MEIEKKYIQIKQEKISELTSFIAKDRNNWKAYLDRAEEYMEIGDFNAAIGDLNQFLGNSRDNIFLSKAYIERGNAKLALGYLVEAVEDYYLAIQADSKNTLAYHHLATTKNDLKEYETVISTYDRIIEIDPADACAYHNRGMARENLGEYQDAILDYTKSIELYETDEEERILPYFSRGNAKSKVGDIKGAILDYQRVLELKPRIPYDRLLIGKARRYTGDKEGAIRDFTKIINSNEYLASRAYYEIAITKLEIGDLQGASKDANQAIYLSSLHKDNFDKSQALHLIENIKM